MDSDKVLVMSAGEAVEFDVPHLLLQNPDGYFTGMVKETGATMESKLREIAAEAYREKEGDSSEKGSVHDLTKME